MIATVRSIITSPRWSRGQGVHGMIRRRSFYLRHSRRIEGVISPPGWCAVRLPGRCGTANARVQGWHRCRSTERTTGC